VVAPGVFGGEDHGRRVGKGLAIVVTEIVQVEVASCRLSVVSGQWSVASCQWSVVNGQFYSSRRSGTPSRPSVVWIKNRFLKKPQEAGGSGAY
jgi:hypothetical protein